jgi:Rha family phage regulatory protein
VAEVFGKNHHHVIDAIEDIQCSQEFRETNFRLSSYVTSQNKEMKMYEFSRDGFSFLVMGFTGAKAAQFKESPSCELKHNILYP